MHNTVRWMPNASSNVRMKAKFIKKNSEPLQTTYMCIVGHISNVDIRMNLISQCVF